jgi:hypothetical protein
MTANEADTLLRQYLLLRSDLGLWKAIQAKFLQPKSPFESRSVRMAATKGANCAGCSHAHYLRKPRPHGFERVAPDRSSVGVDIKEAVPAVECNK